MRKTKKKLLKHLGDVVIKQSGYIIEFLSMEGLEYTFTLNGEDVTGDFACYDIATHKALDAFKKARNATDEEIENNPDAYMPLIIDVTGKTQDEIVAELDKMISTMGESDE